MYFQRRSSPSRPRDIIIPRRPSNVVQQPNIPNLSLKETQKTPSQPNIPNLSLRDSINVVQQPNIPNLSLNQTQQTPSQPNIPNLRELEDDKKVKSLASYINAGLKTITEVLPPPPPPPPVLDESYHYLFDSDINIYPADGSNGESKFLNSSNYSALKYIGFKIGPYTRIKNCRISFTDNSYVAEFGINTNWDIVKYFSSHDLTITSDGIGRTGTGNFGNGWQHDVCGFYLDIPQDVIQSEKEIIVDYEFSSNASNKNTVGFWNTLIPNGSLDFSVDKNAIGTWDNFNIPRAMLPTALIRESMTPQGNITSGTLYNRRVVIRSSPIQKVVTIPSLNNQVRISYGEGRFVCSSYFNSNAIYSDDNGLTWNTIVLPANNFYGPNAYGGGNFIILSSSGSISVYSEDGITWQNSSGHTLQPCSDVVYGNDRFISINQSFRTIYISTDNGLTWQRGTGELDPQYTGWKSITYGNGIFVAGLDISNNVNKISYSQDLGNTWNRTLVSSLRITSIAYGGGKFVAVASNTNKIAYSEDGINWSEQTVMPITANWTDITYGNGKFVAIATGTDKVAYSEDGINWKLLNLEISSTWYRIATNENGKFLITTENTNNLGIVNI